MLKQKLSSRKLWAAVAAFLFSVSTSIAGLHTNNQHVVIFGVVCGVISMAIYQAIEAAIDTARIEAEVEKKIAKVETLEPCIGYTVPSGEEDNTDE